MAKWKDPVSAEVVESTAKALRAKGLEVHVVDNKDAAREAVLSLIPKGSEVFTSSSITVEELGLDKVLNDTTQYDAVKPKLYGFDRATQANQARKYGAAPDFIVGSVHALTQSGTAVIASLTGSQLGAYAYAGGTVVWVIGTQKIVADLEEGMQRLQDYVVPQESVRARKAYGLPDTFQSAANKVLIFNAEVNPARIKIVLVNQSLGF